MEYLRQIAQRHLGSNSRIYRMAARLVDFLSILKSEGLDTCRLLRRLAVSSCEGNQVAVALRRLSHPIVIRPATSDVPSVINNCIREEYGQFEETIAPKLIIDAGAYIGDTSAYFLSRFPGAKVIALEPNTESFLQADLNLRPYGDRVTLVCAALWDSIGMIDFGGEQTSARVGGGGAEVRTITIPALLSKFENAEIDILKMDIEGAELVVLRSAVGNWLNNVRLLLLETHGQNVELEVLPLVEREGFHCHRYRNVWYCYNSRLSQMHSV